MIQPDHELDVSSKGRLPTRRTYAGAFVFLAALFMLTTCAGPTEVSPAAITLRVSAPPSVLVHQQALLTVRAVNQHGAEVDLPEPLAWTSSDSTVASVTPTGVLRGLGRGNAVITARAGGTSATVPLRVRARVRIASADPAWGNPPPLELAVGDSVQFMAHYVDVNGVPIDETPSIEWASSHPAGVSVSASGLLVGIRALSHAVVTGSSPDGLDSVPVSVSAVIAGLPATIRFAHAVRDAGPVTFTPSKGAPVTLSFGEAVQRPILSGMFHITIEWGPEGNRGDRASYHGRPTMIRGGDRLELYAIKTPPGLVVGGEMVLAETWGNIGTMPPDSALVRFIQSSPFLVFDVQPPGGAASENPRHCYFDPGDWTEYAPLAAGDFDLILKDKGSGPERVRIRASAPGGRGVTYVIIGETAETTGLLAFPDP